MIVSHELTIFEQSFATDVRSGSRSRVKRNCLRNIFTTMSARASST